ncbi:PQQ-binding-like beta-propeller repeat protein [Amycolatopsis saalfeldensis]|uniref:outer membrane protein assembly factor BamB family protein n=1 Tax=Amycolatopsis saalfeldensis TaxID=394193 RepID=UPI0011604E85|nr:PQQ-binding-like beta-propeller repeat protein [Amycolatopsis saalfeldensis]
MTRPGWYQDPAGGPGLRWWDGGQWTAHQCVAPGLGALGAVAQAPAPGADVLNGRGAVEPAAWSPQGQAGFPGRPREVAVPPAAPRSNRRRFLWIAGAVGLAAAGGVAAVTLTRDAGHGGEEPAPPAGAPVPSGPAPTWTQALDHEFDNGDRSGDLGVLGSVVVRWDSAVAQAFDVATGAPRWTGRPDLPAGYSGVSWLGLHGSSLFGNAKNDETNSTLLFALGSDGKQQFSHDVGRNARGAGFTRVFDFDGTTALLGTTNEIVAIEVSSGNQLWRRALTAYDRGLAVIGGQRCYLQDYTATLCLHILCQPLLIRLQPRRKRVPKSKSAAARVRLLPVGLVTTGNQLWAIPGTATGNGPTSLVSVADVLAVAGERLVVLDAATGAQRPTALQASTGISRAGVAADLLVVGEHHETESGETAYTVWGIDPRTGAKTWATPVPRPMITGVITSADLVLVPTSSAVSLSPDGFLALDGKTGAIAWAESGAASSGATAEWLACASQNAVYAASKTTVYAYPRQP